MKTAPRVHAVAFSFAFFARLRRRVLALGAAALLVCVGVQAQVVDTAAVRQEVDSLIQVSRALTRKGDFDKALEINAIAGKMALEKFGRESAPYGSACFNHGRVLHFKGDSPGAEKWYLESNAIREKVLGKEHPDYAWSLNNLATLYWHMGNYEKAEPLFLEALAIRGKVQGKEHRDYALSLNNLAILYSHMGNYEKAEPLYLEARTIQEKTLGKEHPDYAINLNNLAVLYKSMGNYEKAEPLYLEALAIQEKVLGKEHPDYARSLNNLANLYRDMGNYEKAEPLFLEALVIREKTVGKEHPDYAQSLSDFAILYYNMGNYEKAEPLYLEALAIKEKVLGKEHTDYAVSLQGLGALYRDMGNYEKAEPLNLKALAIREKVLGKEHPDYALSLYELANLYYEMGNYEKAEPFFLEALAIREKVLSKKHPRYAQNLHILAVLYLSMGNYEKVEPLYFEACTIQEKTLGKEHPDYALSQHDLAIFYWTVKKFDAAQSFLSDALKAYESLLLKASRHLSERELNSYIQKFAEKGDQLFSFAQTTAGVDSLCFDFTLFHKGFLLNAISQLNGLALSDSVTAEKYYQIKSYNRRLASEYAKPIAERKNVNELEEKANALEKELTHAVAGFGEALRQVNWREVQQQLKADEAAIEFVHYEFFTPKSTDSTLYAALILLPGDTAPHFIPLCEQRQLDALIPERKGPMNNYLQNLYAFAPVNNRASLYQLLWEPLERIFREKGVKTVYYSPSGLLHRLNLAAIAPDKSGQTLADRYRLVPMGSTRQLVVGSGSGGVQITDALIYGGIQYNMDSTAIARANNNLAATAQDTTGGLFRYASRGGDNFAPLPGSEAEARHLFDLLRQQGVSSTLRMGYSATEESFKQIGQNGPSPSLLHIGTHGFFFPDPKDTTRRRSIGFGDDAPAFKISEYPLIRSGLLFAGAQYAWDNKRPMSGMEDGILTAHEVSQMNLSNTELVVLSACETGLGDIKGNEGVYGLQRAFRIAGAKNVLMSLWKVPDEATEKLMTRFYQNWLEEKMPLRESFEAAQKWMRRQKGYENPYFWAGFVLIGEG